MTTGRIFKYFVLFINYGYMIIIRHYYYKIRYLLYTLFNGQFNHPNFNQQNLNDFKTILKTSNNDTIID